MRDVYLIGGGQTKITKNGGIRGRYMAAEAINQALGQAQIDRERIGMPAIMLPWRASGPKEELLWLGAAPLKRKLFPRNRHRPEARPTKQWA